MGASPVQNRKILFAFAALAVTAAIARAAVLPALPLYGGDVRALVFDPADPERAFAGTAAGQLYRSDDGGASWRETGATVPFPNWVVGSLVFDAHRAGRLWAGLRGLWEGGGVAFSDDLGATWTWRTEGGLGAEPVYALATVPTAADRLFAAGRGGVWRSDDAGASWSKVSQGVDGLTQVGSLAIDPRAPQRIVAGTWRRAFRSDDGGRSWRGVFTGMALDTEVFQLRVAPRPPGRLWAATCGWVYRGDGFGEGWSRVRAGFEERRTRALEVLTPQRLVVGTVAGAYLSTDGGESFRRARDPGLSIVALAHHPARPERVLAATDGAGVWRSLDGGASYEPASLGLAALRVAAVLASGDTLYAAVPWAGPLAGVYRSLDGGARFERLEPGLAAPLGLALADGRLFAATADSLLVREGESWLRVAGGEGVAVSGLRGGPGPFVVTVGGRLHRWRDGRLTTGSGEPAQEAASAAPPVMAEALPKGAVRAATRFGGRLVLATAGFGLRWAEAGPSAPASLALEAGEDAQVGGEPLRRDR